MRPMSDQLDRALARAEADFPLLLERLKALVRIPSCSFPGFDHAANHQGETQTQPVFHFAPPAEIPTGSTTVSFEAFERR